MKDSELISRVKKEIKLLDIELQESSAQLGGVFYDSEMPLNNSGIISELNSLEAEIPEIKSKLESFQAYNLTISESEEKIKECNNKIKELESKIGSVLEKVGVELYCFIGERELAFPEVKSIYTELKEGELKSETLENRLYKYENNDVKKGIRELVSKPFKVRSIKREIIQNNKDSLKRFKGLGKVYCETSTLIDEENNDAILDILEDYKVINKSIQLQKKNVDKFNLRISENEEKIEEGSHGVKLKTLYSKLEQEIATTQNFISVKLVELGYEVASTEDLDIDKEEIQAKLDSFNSIKAKITIKNDSLFFLENRVKQTVLQKEISSITNSIKIEEDHIKTLTDKLGKDREDLSKMSDESSELDLWLTEHHVDF